MKKIVSLIILIICSQIFAIEVQRIDSIELPGNYNRDAYIAYHNNIHEFNLYGSNRWAVYFDVNSYFSVDTLTVKPVTIEIFSPQPLTDVVFRFYPTSSNLPDLDNELSSVTDVDLITGWNSIEVPDMSTVSTFWLVIEATTSSTNQLGASSGTGENSYFWTGTNQNGYFTSFYENTINAELLIGLTVEMVDVDVDLEITDFDYLIYEDHTINFVLPYLNIKNNGSSSISEFDLSLKIESPIPQDSLTFSWADTITFNMTIEPNESITISDVEETKVFLPTFPAQYNAKARLIVDDFSAVNNSKENSFNTFIEDSDKWLVESFIELNNLYSESIVNSQNELLNDNWLNLYLFTDTNDNPYYSLDSFYRFYYYDLLGTPSTVINGTNQITGYSSSYEDLFSDYISSYEMQKTFINLASASGTYNEAGIYTFNCLFKNASTYVFDDLGMGLSLFAALVETPDNTEFNYPTFRSLLSSTAGEQLTLHHDDSTNVEIVFDINSINLIDDIENEEIFFWIQNSSGIYYANLFQLADFDSLSTGNTDILKPQNSFSTYPNPFSQMNNLIISINTDRSNDRVDFSFYNLKGQLINRIENHNPSRNNTTSWNGIDEKNQLVPNGIYFIKADFYSKNNKTDSQLKKVLFIK